MIPARVEKRNRPPKSCEPCRIRKLKCNRGLPCDTCLKRGNNITCHYASNANRVESRHDNHDPLRQRLKNLEDLVSSMAQQDTPNFPTPSDRSSSGPSMHEGWSIVNENDSQSPREGTGQPLGNGTFHGRHAGYTDSNHWSSVLDIIKSIREELSPSSAQASISVGDQSFQDDDHSVVDLGLASTRISNMHEVLQRLPPREICDNLVTQYFRLENIVLPVIHPHKFQREYMEFWKTPASASPLWVALLFAILSLSSNLFTSMHPGRESATIPPAESLSLMTEQCLILGDYVLAQEHSVEAMIIHNYGLYLRAKESDVKLWFLMGTLIRLAISKGYHRDPSRLSKSSTSPFENEMRRRIWICIFQADTLMSFQMGLPSMIPSEYCDADLPRNLTYSDFQEDTTVMPASRPFSDYTPISYAIVKTTVMAMFKEVVSHTRSLTPPPYDKTLSLDKETRSVYDQVPSNFKYKPLRDSIFESSGIIMNRATVELLHLKTIIVLHRQYVTNLQDRRYHFSRGACVQASRCILDRQAELFEATKPNGQLHEERFMISSLVTHDFILAAMVVCLDLTIRSQSLRNSETSGISEAADPDSEFEESLAAIRQAHHIWAAAIPYSSEARIVAQALDSTIQRVDSGQSIQRSMGVLDGTQKQTTSSSFESSVHPYSTEGMHDSSDGIAPINWGLVDDTLSEGLDLESWILDSSGL